MRITFDTTVANGFPVTVEALIENYDAHSYDHYGLSPRGRKVVEEIEVFKRGTHKNVDFITRKLTDSDWQDLNREALDEYLSGYADD